MSRFGSGAGGGLQEPEPLEFAVYALLIDPADLGVIVYRIIVLAPDRGVQPFNAGLRARLAEDQFHRRTTFFAVARRRTDGAGGFRTNGTPVCSGGLHRTGLLLLVGAMSSGQTRINPRASDDRWPLGYEVARL